MLRAVIRHLRAPDGFFAQYRVACVAGAFTGVLCALAVASTSTYPSVPAGVADSVAAFMFFGGSTFTVLYVVTRLIRGARSRARSWRRPTDDSGSTGARPPLSDPRPSPRPDRPRRIFVSYAREDRAAAVEVIEGLTRTGHEVWWDRALSGGEEWWTTILAKIRESDVVVAAVSPASATSTACQFEVLYADAVNRPILPLVVRRVKVGTLPPVIVSRQIQYYVPGRRGPAGLLELDRAVRGLPLPGPPPDRLPAPPPVPGLEINVLAQRVRQVDPLDRAAQYDTVVRLRMALHRADDRHVARSLLHELRERPEISHELALEITSTLGWRDAGHRRRPDRNQLVWIYTGSLFTFGLLGVLVGGLNLRNPQWRPHPPVLLGLSLAWGVYAVTRAVLGTL